MKQAIQNIQNKLAETSSNYIDEDWGQLDYYSPNFPVKWPCTLIDVTSANYQNKGRDRTATPEHRQTAMNLVSIKVANLRLTKSSKMAPQSQKDAAWSIWDLIDETHTLMQGFRPLENSGGLIRTGLRRVQRDDGVQEYVLLYSWGLNDC